MKNFGSAGLDSAVIKAGLCIGCGACIGLCPYFQSYRGKTAMLFPCEKEKGRCFAYCPKVEVDPERLSSFLFNRGYDGSPLGHWRSIYISRAGAKVKRHSFQAGGTVSALVYFALRSRRIRAAVLTGQAQNNSLLPVPVPGHQAGGCLSPQPLEVCGCLDPRGPEPGYRRRVRPAGRGCHPLPGDGHRPDAPQPPGRPLVPGPHGPRHRPVLHVGPRLPEDRGLPRGKGIPGRRG